MTTRHPDSSRQSAWQNYWSNERTQPAYATQGRLTAILNAHWDSIFSAHLRLHRPARCLDIAAGNGDLCARLLNFVDTQGASLAELLACDLSYNATRQLESMPRINAVRCDAACLPFRDQHFDLVASQFGIEYAGMAAMDECARVAAPDGTVALVMHHNGGALYQENQAILAAVEEFRAANLLNAFAVLAEHNGDTASHEGFVKSVKAAEAALHRHGPEVAAGALLRLYREVATLHGSLSRYEATEIRKWCLQMSESIDSYADRTRWMINAALTRDDMTRVKLAFETRGLTVLAHEPVLDRDRPVAWSLIATRVNAT